MGPRCLASLCVAWWENWVCQNGKHQGIKSDQNWLKHNNSTTHHHSHICSKALALPARRTSKEGWSRPEPWRAGRIPSQRPQAQMHRWQWDSGKRKPKNENIYIPKSPHMEQKGNTTKDANKKYQVGACLRDTLHNNVLGYCVMELELERRAANHCSIKLPHHI